MIIKFYLALLKELLPENVVEGLLVSFSKSVNPKFDFLPESSSSSSSTKSSILAMSINCFC